MASTRAQRDPKARANLLSQEARGGNAVETNRTADLDNFGLVGYQRQLMKGTAPACHISCTAGILQTLLRVNFSLYPTHEGVA